VPRASDNRRKMLLTFCYLAAVLVKSQSLSVLEAEFHQEGHRIMLPFLYAIVK
jgi:hypothetical protein